MPIAEGQGDCNTGLSSCQNAIVFNFVGPAHRIRGSWDTHPSIHPHWPVTCHPVPVALVQTGGGTGVYKLRMVRGMLPAEFIKPAGSRLSSVAVLRLWNLECNLFHIS